MFYLSFDCANKSLGVSYFQYDLESRNSLINLCDRFYLVISTKDYVVEYDFKDSILNNINRLKSKLKTDNFIHQYIQFLIALNKILDSIIDIKYLDVVNLLGEKKTKDVDVIVRSQCLKNNLAILDNKIFHDVDTMVIIEYQMNCNDKSRTIYNQLIYHYSCKDKFIVKTIAPAFKNKIYFNDSLKHNTFIQQYKNNYIANKRHTSANFIFFIDTFKKNYMIKHIKKKNIDDLADSFIQALYIIKKTLTSK